MNRLLHLHIGPPKTGSTAVQAALAANRRPLRGRGFWVPEFERNHRFLVSAFRPNPERFDYNAAAGRGTAEAARQHNAAMLARFEAGLAASGCRHCLLSAEHMVQLQPRAIAALADYLRGLFGEVRIYLYARDPVAQSCSLVQERVKNGAGRLAAALAAPPFTRYSRLAGRWEAVFGRDALRLRPYGGSAGADGGAAGWDAGRDFLQWTGALAGGAPPQEGWKLAPVRVNASLSQAGVLLADALTGIAPKHSGLRHAQKYLREIGGPRFCLPPAAAARVADAAAGELDYLRREWGIVPPGAGAASAAAQRTEAGADARPDTGAAGAAEAAGAAGAFGPAALESLARLLNGLAADGPQDKP